MYSFNTIDMSLCTALSRYYIRYMKLTVDPGSSNYAATVVQLTTFQAIPDRDRIQITVLNGNQVIISKEAKIGDIGLYFVSGTELAHDFCYNNNLYEDKTQNLDVSQRGYISHKRRVRAIRMAGTISDGMFLPLDSLHYLGVKDLKLGDEFTHIDGTLVCQKYVVAVRNANPGGTQPPKEKNRLRDLMIPNQFRFHHETAHLGKNLGKITPQTELVITAKLHGSSCILSKVKTIRKLSVVEKVAKFLGAKIVETEYTGIYSSGKPKSSLVKGIDSKWTNDGPSFYASNIWKDAYTAFKYALEPGISIYGELVSELIQKPYDYTHIRRIVIDTPEKYVGQKVCKYSGKPFLSGLKENTVKGVVIHPELTKIKGRDINAFVFEEDTSYVSCDDVLLTTGFAVYRITRTNDEGHVDEFSWHQVEAYCKKYGLQTVPVLFKGDPLKWAGFVSKDSYPFNEDITPEFYIQERFSTELADKYLEKKCSYSSNDVFAEGVCIRIEHPYEVFKLKSKNFLLGEEKVLDSETPNIEDEN